MKRRRLSAVLVLLFSIPFIPSCAMLRDIREMLDTSKRASTKVDAGLVVIDKGLDKIDKGLAAYNDAKKSADTNRDGKTDSKEWLLWLLGAGGGGGLLGFMRRNAKSDERKAVMETRLAAIEAKA